jgi:GH15 family glucan-1,4-alpha-glucosidase
MHVLEFAPIFGGMKKLCKTSHCRRLPGVLSGIPGRDAVRALWHAVVCSSIFFLLLAAFPAKASAQTPSQTAVAHPRMELSRPARPWEFISAVGKKAAVFGNESGRVEAWVYPLKIFRDLHLVFHIGGRAIPAESAVRTIVTRPEAVAITYSGDSFSVEETFFVPRDEPGAVIALQVKSHTPIDVEVVFQRDFQLMWPAAIGGTFVNWDDKARAFVFGEEQKKWFALLGSPSATAATTDFETNYSSSAFNSFRLGLIPRGSERKLIVIAGSVKSQADAAQTYELLATNYDHLLNRAAGEYAEYLRNAVSLLLPDPDLQRAYDWARVSVLQGLVTNPFLGTGLIAGYRTSGTGARPGFAWFFGRDALWTSLALNSEGDFTTTRQALEFLMKYQRQDGKVEHEIAQSAAQVPWFSDFPYAFASADATPLFLIAMSDYVAWSGDASFTQTNWDHIWRAYQFLRSTFDERGVARNAGIGHGWVEGGPLLPVKSEFYQDGLATEALRAFSNLAALSGHTDLAGEAAALFQQHQRQLNQLFWSPERNFFVFAINQQDQRVDIPTVLSTVPMWFGLTDPAKTESTITQLADADHATDWGMRIISATDPRFDPSGYHFGSVWPLFTGWAAVGEYRYHRQHAAYANLRANALLALSGSLGHVTEVLSGEFFEPVSTSSPHQIWSSAMIISPLLRGMLGIQADAGAKRLDLAPHTPADWTWWKAANVRMGSATFDLALSSTASSVTLTIDARQAADTNLHLSYPVSRNAKVVGVELDGAPAKYSLEKNTTDQHVVLMAALRKPSIIVRIRMENTFALVVPSDLPRLGETSRNLKVLSESWTGARNDAVTFEFDGLAGQTYELPIRGSAHVQRVEGAQLISLAGSPAVRIRVPAEQPGYRHLRVTISFAPTRQ